MSFCKSTGNKLPVGSFPHRTRTWGWSFVSKRQEKAPSLTHPCEPTRSFCVMWSGPRQCQINTWNYVSVHLDLKKTVGKLYILSTRISRISLRETGPYVHGKLWFFFFPGGRREKWELTLLRQEQAFLGLILVEVCWSLSSTTGACISPYLFLAGVWTFNNFPPWVHPFYIILLH